MLLVRLLRSVTAVVGELNTHVALSVEQRDEAKFRQRIDEIRGEVDRLLERFERHWPDLPPLEPPKSP